MRADDGVGDLQKLPEPGAQAVETLLNELVGAVVLDDLDALGRKLGEVGHQVWVILLVDREELRVGGKANQEIEMGTVD